MSYWLYSNRSPSPSIDSSESFPSKSAYHRQSVRLISHQCDQIRRYLKFLVTCFLSKVPKMYGEFLGYSEKQHFSCLTTVVNSWATFDKKGLLFKSVSGHSVSHLCLVRSSCVYAGSQSKIMYAVNVAQWVDNVCFWCHLSKFDSQPLSIFLPNVL